jgi:threonine dehydrogenase-like Zn-dependent dehydrogenase
MRSLASARAVRTFICGREEERMQGVIRAAVIASPRETRMEMLPSRPPGESEVRVRLEGCGVCHSNLPAWEGRPWFQYPLSPGTPGHEGWGHIEAIGANVRGLQEGDRVAFLGSTGYASHAVALARECVKLPPTLDGRPFPGEAVACAVNIFRRSRIEAGQSVAIVGIGFLGALLTRLCSRAGARVIAVARRPFSQQLARRYGASEVVSMEDHRTIVERIAQLTSGTFCDRAIECVGEQWPLDLASELTRERGTVVIAGYHQDGPRQVNLQLWNWRGLDVVNAHERDPQVYVEGMRIGVDLAARGELDPAPLLSHVYPLEKLGEAFEALKARPGDFVKAWVRP